MSLRPKNRGRGRSMGDFSKKSRRGHAVRRASCIESLESRLYLSTAAVAYTWQNAVIGAGGFVDGVFFDPNNNGVMYARTDIGGLYRSTNGGNNWQQLLDFVGDTSTTSGNGTGQGEFEVLSFAIDPENSNNLYALVGGNGASGNNGNVLYSTNAGQTWSVSSPSGLTVSGNGTARGAGERLAVDPNDSNIIFIGSNASTGLWESTNGGQTFTKITATGLPADDVDFVEFDSYGGTKGSPSQTIFVGVTAKTTGSNIYESTNGGANFSEISNSGGGPASYYPMRAAFDSTNDGYVYFTFANQVPPEGTISTNGGVWRYNVNTSAWANITPTIPNVNGNSLTSGWVGLGVGGPVADNASNTPGTVIVTTFDHYSGNQDYIFRTTNANAASPTWTYLNDGAATRNYSLAPYMAEFNTPGIGNWAATAQIDPYNPAHIVYGTGQGLWTTLTGNSSTPLTAPNSWYFLDSGIEFTSALDLAAPATGNPLLSGLGDIGGFVQTTLTSSPAAGAIEGTASNLTSIDFAQGNQSIEAAVGAASNGDAYSTNYGVTWTPFATRPGSSGTIAVSANGSNFVWAPSGVVPYYSGNDGATWTASTMPTGFTLTGLGTEKVISDRGVNSTTFYYWTENTNDNSWQLYISTNGGQTFVADGAAQGNGNVTLIANPFTAGDLWFSSYNGIWHSVNSGTSFSQISSIGYANVPSMALGAPAPGQTTPAIYMYGTYNNFLGVWRSDDGGKSWIQLTTYSQQFGGNINSMAADPNVFGRVYLGVNGSGIEIGNPASNQADADIGTPGNPGWATGETTLSSTVAVGYTTVNQWTIAGGGAGITAGGTSDQLNFAYDSLSGNGAVTAELTGLTNGDVTAGTPEAGVMFRAGTNPGDIFVAMLQTDASTNNVIFAYRSTTNGPVTMVTYSGTIPVGAEYLQVTRSGNLYTGSYSSNGVNFTSLGSISISAAMSDVGLAASAGYNPQLTSATFTNVSIPGVATAAAVSGATTSDPTVITTTSANLTVLGIENGTDSGLTYTWSATGPAGVTFSGTTNGTNAAKNITAVFSQAGNYTFAVTVADANGYSTTSSVAVFVNQTLTSMTVSPTSATVNEDSNQQFSATAYDQFANALTSQPTITWSVTSGIGSVNSSGLYTSPASSGSATVQAASGSVHGSASVTIDNATPTVQTTAAANPSPVTGTTTALSVLGADDGGPGNLSYTWSYTGPTGVTYTGNTNGTNAAQNITANFTQAGSYSFTATITDSGGLFTTSSVNVTVQQTPTNIVVSPATSPVVPVGFTQQFSATATDQFGNAISSPSFGWGIAGSGNSINGTGDATLGSTPGSFTVTATDGSAQGMATVIAEDFAVPSGATLDINLGPAGPVTLSASGSNITASQNGVQITLSGFTGVTVTDTASNDVLNFNGLLSIPFTFVNCGSSTVNVNNGTLIFAAVMGGTINLGNLSVANGAGAMITAATTNSPTTLSLNALTIGPTGQLDVANNQVLINYGSGTDPITTIAGWIATGYAGAAWDGYGIISSVAQTNSNYGLGYADANDTNNPAGLPSGEIKIMYTLLGDANLDGTVNSEDFSLFSHNLGQTSMMWDDGDFNYDGTVNSEDFSFLSENLGQTDQIAAQDLVQATPAAPVAATVSPPAASTTVTNGSNDNDIVSTVLGKHAAKKKPKH
jgi:hypothetical protein